MSRIDHKISRKPNPHAFYSTDIKIYNKLDKIQDTLFMSIVKK